MINVFRILEWAALFAAAAFVGGLFFSCGMTVCVRILKRPVMALTIHVQMPAPTVQIFHPEQQQSDNPDDSGPELSDGLRGYYR